MGQPVVATVQLAAADNDGISVSQAVAAAGNLTITGALASGGVATLTAIGAGRQVIITSGGNDTGINFTVYGLDEGYIPISETFAGANAGVATSTTLFRTVTRIAASGAVATTVIAGTNGVGATRWVNHNIHAQPCNISFSCDVTGTVNYTLQHTYDPLDAVIKVWDDAIIVGATADTVASFSYPITGSRILVNSGTGTVVATVIQAGIVGG